MDPASRTYSIRLCKVVVLAGPNLHMLVRLPLNEKSHFQAAKCPGRHFLPTLFMLVELLSFVCPHSQDLTLINLIGLWWSAQKPGPSQYLGGFFFCFQNLLFLLASWPQRLLCRRISSLTMETKQCWRRTLKAEGVLQCNVSFPSLSFQTQPIHPASLHPASSKKPSRLIPVFLF